MKKLFLVLGALLVVFVVVVAYAVANLDSYLNQNREWVSAQAESVMGRAVDFGEIGISFSGGLGVRVEDLRIDDDPDFSEEPFVTAGAIDLRVALLPALFGNIEVDHVVLRSPAITVVQTSKGLSTSTLGGGEAPAEEPPAELGLPAFTVRIVDVSDGTLRYVDKTASPAGETVVSHLDFTARDVSLAGPVPFEVKAAVLGASRQNVRIAGEVRNLQAPQAQFTLTSSALELAPGEGDGPRDALRDLEVKGELSMPTAGPRVKATVRSANGTFAGFDYGNLAVDFGLQDQVANIEKLSVGMFGGTLGATGRYDMKRAERPRFDLQTTLSSMQLAKLAASLSPKAEGSMQGELGGTLALAGAGTSWEQIRPNLTGHGNVLLVDGVIRDVNLAETALRGITGVPGLSNLLSPELREKYPQAFSVGDTVFENMDAKIDIRDGKAAFSDFKLAARDYAVAGEGTYALDNRLDLATRMTFSQPLSDSLVQAAKPIGYLRTPEGRVAIPVKLVGPVPDIKPVPDVNYIAKAASRQAVGSLLDKTLGAQTGGAPAEGQPAQPSPEGSTSDMIKKGLGGLFGK